MTTGFSESSGRSVVDATSAEEIGEVKTFVVDRAGDRVTQLQVTGRKRNAQLVDWNDVQSFGADAVLISSGEALHDAPDERTDETVRGNIEFLGAMLLSTDGQALGTVADVHFDETTGAIEAVLGDEAGRIEAGTVRGVGSYAVVIERG